MKNPYIDLYIHLETSQDEIYRSDSLVQKVGSIICFMYSEVLKKPLFSPKNSTSNKTQILDPHRLLEDLSFMNHLNNDQLFKDYNRFLIQRFSTLRTFYEYNEDLQDIYTGNIRALIYRLKFTLSCWKNGTWYISEYSTLYTK